MTDHQVSPIDVCRTKSLGCSVTWTLRSLDDASLADVSRPWTAYRSRIHERTYNVIEVN